MAFSWTAVTFVLCFLCCGVYPQVADEICYERADILFVMDASGSVGSNNFQTQLEFAAKFVDRFSIGTSQFSVIRFDDSPSIIFPFNRYTDAASLKNAILKITYTAGGTNTAAALQMARERAFLPSNGVRPGVARIVIVSTDGQSNNPNQTATEAYKLKNSNALVLAMGIGNSVNSDELDRIASYHEDVFLIPDYDRLLSIVQEYSQLACEEVKLFQCYNKTDVYFLFDSSSKIPQEQFKNAINYATSITTRFDLSFFSFGAATFGGTDVKSVFKLGQITDRSTLTQTLSAAAYTGGATDTDAALKYIKNQDVFNPAEGGRPNVLKILVVFTDGGSVTRTQALATAKELTATGVKIITVGVANPDISELQELVEAKAQDVITSLSFYINAYNRLATLTGLDVCITPVGALRGAEDACRLYNWENGIHPHPYDCTKYILCTFLKTDIMPCAQDLAYDPDIQTCIEPGYIKTPCTALPTRNSTYPPQIVTPPPTTHKPCVKGTLDILYLLDSSENVGNPGFAEILKFASNLAENFLLGPDAIQFAATSFGLNVLNLFDYNDYDDYKPLQQAILGASYLGGVTNTFTALQHAQAAIDGSRDGAAKLAIVFSSGRSSDPQKTIQEATALKNAGFHIISVGFANPNLQELQSIASSPSEVFVNNFNGVLQSILRYSNSTCLVTVCVGVQFADVIFVLDSSNSITDSDYQTQLRFVADVTDNFRLGLQDIRFGALIFSQDTVKLFDLDDYGDHTKLRSAIMSAGHLKSGTDTAKALNFVVDNRMFHTSVGGRDNATKILIILTDGRSNSENDTIRAAERLKATGVKFIAVGIGNDSYVEELTLLASDSRNLFLVPGYPALKQIQDSVTRRTCEIPKDTPNVPDYSYLCASFRWQEGQHPNPYDCSTYVVCQSFVTLVYSCPTGDAYDPVVLKCGDRATAHPCNDPNYFGPSVTLPPIVTTRAPVVLGNICKDRLYPDGLYPDPGSCNKFVQCTAFDTQIQTCPDGLNFNTANSVCDDVHLVDCNINYGS